VMKMILMNQNSLDNFSWTKVDADKIEALYENGLLNLLIPKKEEAKQRPPRMIEIKG